MTRAPSAQDLVERAAELRVAVVDCETRVREAAADVEVARLLGHPPSGGVCAAAGAVDAASGDLDQEQRVVAAQEGAFRREEVEGDDAGRLAT
jgi:hypothetical protein